MKPSYDRLFVKMIRDKTRKSLSKADVCWVTGQVGQLEIHHMYTMSALVSDYLRKHNITITDDNKLEVRDAIIKDEYNRLHEQVVLSKTIHAKLHSIFGTKYPNYIVPKVRLWLERQKDSYEQLGD